MKTTPVSTMGLINASREMRTNLQFKIAEGQKEANTGRYADVGVSIGYLTERTLSLRNDLERLQTFKDTNAVAASRLELTQTQLDGMAGSAQEFLTSLMAARSSRSSANVAVSDARSKMTAFAASMNTAVNGAYLFAGVNTDVKPLGDTFASDVQTAVQAAFATAFPGPVEDINAADMKAFLDGQFAALFDSANWTTSLSQASDQNITSRI
ncbi:MAG: flagellar hook-associated protein FlgL, partial [Xanthomonadaceae bacterium]|nr:flagellar hook-associated protein FlgL [Xanthomonadaceae bacterium]